MWLWQKKERIDDRFRRGPAELPLTPEDKALKNAVAEWGVECSSFRRYFGEGREAVYGFSCSGAKAVATWNKLRGVGSTGFWPIVLGLDADLEFHRRSTLAATRSADAIAASGDVMDARPLIHGANLGCDAELEEWLAFDGDEGPPDTCGFHGDWPESRPTLQPALLSHGAVPILHFGLIQTAACWHAPAYLHFGGHNGCPSAERHVAVLRRWNDLYGAEPMAISHDVLEMHVRRPPATREQALHLAEEQFNYCYDSIIDGKGTLERLASTVIASPYWRFRWNNPAIAH